ncbi:MAG: BrnT family toxin [Deltaproteobacteria bacterium]|nr:BrnT family toxin [Deltaproteobacteria bacterium]
MKFEWDIAKNAENARKHGLFLEEAIAIWESEFLEIEEIARSEEGEKRNATMGWVNNKLYVAIWTQRGEKIRLISVRRARENEEKIFHEKIQNQR